MRRPSKIGGRLRMIERDAPADARARSCHIGMARGYTGATLAGLRDFLTEPQVGTRIHKDDMRQMVHLIHDFETELRELFEGMRVQQHGVPDPSIEDTAGVDLSNVISLKDRRATEPGVRT